VRAIYVDQLRDAAEAAERAEAEFRGYAERRIETMSAERVRAYRRYQLVNDMVGTARSVADQATCVAAQVACVLAQAGWAESDPAYSEVREQLIRVATLVHHDLHCKAGAANTPEPVLAALQVFESWCRERFGAEFPALLPRAPASLKPLVDF